jgi:hypothetical protein
MYRQMRQRSTGTQLPCRACVADDLPDSPADEQQHAEPDETGLNGL